MDRRTFLKGLGVGTATAIVASHVPMPVAAEVTLPVATNELTGQAYPGIPKGLQYLVHNNSRMYHSIEHRPDYDFSSHL